MDECRRRPLCRVAQPVEFLLRHLHHARRVLALGLVRVRIRVRVRVRVRVRFKIGVGVGVGLGLGVGVGSGLGVLALGLPQPGLEWGLLRCNLRDGGGSFGRARAEALACRTTKRPARSSAFFSAFFGTPSAPASAASAGSASLGLGLGLANPNPYPNLNQA